MKIKMSHKRLFMIMLLITGTVTISCKNDVQDEESQPPRSEVDIKRKVMEIVNGDSIVVGQL